MSRCILLSSACLNKRVGFGNKSLCRATELTKIVFLLLFFLAQLGNVTVTQRHVFFVFVFFIWGHGSSFLKCHKTHVCGLNE